MRANNRDMILDAAIRIVEERGISALTFDAVAAESGITRGGIVYHFPSRDDLVEAVHRSVADQWDAELTAELGGGNRYEASVDDRLIAYIRTCARSSQRAHVHLALDPSDISRNVWEPFFERWVPSDQSDEPRARTRLIVRLAADGMSSNETIEGNPLPPGKREEIAELLEQIVRTDQIIGLS